MMARKQALSVTDAAAERIQALLAKRGKPSVGVRVGVRSRGCSGLSYTLEYADEKGKFDEVVEDKGVTDSGRPEGGDVHPRHRDGLRRGKAAERLYLPQSEREGPLRLRRILPRLRSPFAGCGWPRQANAYNRREA